MISPLLAAQVILATFFYFVVFIAVVAVIENGVIKVIRAYYLAKNYPEMVRMDVIAARKSKQPV